MPPTPLGLEGYTAKTRQETTPNVAATDPEAAEAAPFLFEIESGDDSDAAAAAGAFGFDSTCDETYLKTEMRRLMFEHLVRSEASKKKVAAIKAPLFQELWLDLPENTAAAADVPS